MASYCKHILLLDVFMALFLQGNSINFEDRCEEFGFFWNTAARFCETCTVVCKDLRSQNCVYYCPTYSSQQISRLDAKSNNETSNITTANPSIMIGVFVVVGLAVVALFIVFIARIFTEKRTYTKSTAVEMESNFGIANEIAQDQSRTSLAIEEVEGTTGINPRIDNQVINGEPIVRILSDDISTVISEVNSSPGNNN